jgi:hypothetical protein
VTTTWDSDDDKDSNDSDEGCLEVAAATGPQKLLNTIDVFEHLGDRFQSGHGDPTDRCWYGALDCYDDQETAAQQ